MPRIYERAAILFKPKPRTTPDEWGAANRVYPPSAGVPGPRNPHLTPYGVIFGRRVTSGVYRRCVLTCGNQMAKTETILDIIGRQLDQRPLPILYVGPSKQFLTEQFEPRVKDLLENTPLRSRMASVKKQTKTRKFVAGVPLRLAHAGSSTPLKSDPAALGFADEVDEMLSNVKGQGDPIGLLEARGDTYADFTLVATSTPSSGVSETEVDEASGLEFWKVQEPDDLQSKIWTMWQSGSRHHFAWPCPHCKEYFVPRFSCIEIPKVRYTKADGTEVERRATPAEAKRTAFMRCPRNGCVIEDDAAGKTKAWMLARGVDVAPGQAIADDGSVVGPQPDTDTYSLWVSGLCSPFVSWGERASFHMAAQASGDQQQVKVAINRVGELFAPVGGDVPEWEEVRRLALPYGRLEVPVGARFLTMGVDVQKNRLVYVIRGWGIRQESWLIDAGEIWGETSHDEVWTDLADVIESPIAGMHIRRVFVDAGFRPGKKDMVPEHKVYEFARRFPRTVFASKGFDHRPTPLTVSPLAVKPDGTRMKAGPGIELARIDTDFMKSWVHARLRWPEDQPGGWHVYDGVTDDYCKQLVSEARVKKPGGGFMWVQKARDNHMLDAESLAYAAAYMLGVHQLDRFAERHRARSDRGGVSVRQSAAPPEGLSAPAPVSEPGAVDARNVAAPAPRRPVAARRVYQSSYM